MIEASKMYRRIQIYRNNYICFLADIYVKDNNVLKFWCLNIHISFIYVSYQTHNKYHLQAA